MKTHELIQGSDAWDQFRLTHFGASEAAAMLGLSKKTTRNELLRMKKTGIAKVFSDWVQKNILDHGHAVEEPARKIMEEVIGETLYPVTCSDGEISASCDGLTMAEDAAWENKQWNEEYAALVRAGQVPEEHMPQCQQVLMVTKAERLYFSISDGTREQTVWVKVLPDAAWFDRIRAGWHQFATDLATYTPGEVVAEVVGRTPETLPALRIEVTGMVTASNLAQYREHALAVFAGINRDLKTDQDFANADKTVKWCGEVESRLAAAKQHALSQTESIDVLFKTIDDITAEARSTRLELDKLVKARKEARKGEIVAGGVKGFSDHIAALNARLGKPYMPAVMVDFGGAIKGMRSFDSMQNAVDTTLANAKIAASATADRIQTNLTTLRELAADAPHLFPDTQVIVQKAPEDLTALVKNRIAEHRAAEEKKLEAQRESIRQEELARIEREAEAKRQLIAREQAAQAAAAAPAPVASPITTSAAATPPAATPISAPVAAPAPTVIPMPVRAAAAPASAPTLSIGAINERLQHFTVTEAGLRGLGFEPAGRERAAPRYHESEFPHVLAAIVAHVQGIQAKQAA
ncbi:Phage-related protein, predicted endonuclease [Variovorax sp. YR634]|uniref:YqaJ viral recombinase family protein n=1 Tax=Variovorax sp. YR634 TaxID=1884385 RepID=UPI00089CA869|nr:YqaJ viral recombinase family protein [Variovorax sp. YR634]SDX14797.1 Phage-related protein, predicted endonuclease [Variovorax sp. YR634]